MPLYIELEATGAQPLTRSVRVSSLFLSLLSRARSLRLSISRCSPSRAFLREKAREILTMKFPVVLVLVAHILVAVSGRWHQSESTLAVHSVPLGSEASFHWR